MRPDRDEMVAGIRRALLEYIAGEVSSVYARTELTYAVSLLAAIARESEDAAANLIKENIRLRTLLCEAGEELRQSSLAGGALVEELRRIGVPSPEPDLRLSSLRLENGALLETFIRLQAACEDALEDEAARRVYRGTLTFLRQRAESLASLSRRA